MAAGGRCRSHSETGGTVAGTNALETGDIAASATEPERTFYSVQDEANVARLYAGGEPWPVGTSRSLLGEGFYTWGTRSQAEAYCATLEEHGATGLRILEARVSEAAYRALRTLDLRSLDDATLNAWMDTYSQYGAGGTHGAEHIIRETGNFGPEFYFAKAVFHLFRLEGRQS
jgi:dipeptidyl aminopeptidase/acylaminoacyl peptidase